MSSYYDLLKHSTSKFPQNAAIIVYDDGAYSKFTYKYLYDVSLKIYDYLKNRTIVGEYIGIIMRHDYIIPPIISAIHQCRSAFIFINPDYDAVSNMSVIERLKIRTLFSLKEKPYDGYTSTNISEILNIDKDLFIWNCTHNSYDDIECDGRVSYCIRTSGSTGIPKFVAVPHQCIYPNIEDFISIFKLTERDVIYWSTPLTFDPSIIELFTAVKSGASLLIAPNDVNALFSSNSSITVWQTTPSKFLLHNTDIKSIILSDDTSLRILALGGEPINYNLSALASDNNKTVIFNLYGITEVSCWATFNELKPGETDYYNLGHLLSHTLLKVVDDDGELIEDKIGHIHIGSLTRKCYIDDEIHNCDDLEVVWRDTGDLGRFINGSVHFKCRADRIIKRYGHKLDLQMIESTAQAFNGISHCICDWVENNYNLILFYTSADRIPASKLRDHLNRTLDKYSMPNEVVYLDEFPLNDHGKICRKTIRSEYRKTENHGISSRELFKKLLYDLTNTDRLDATFVEIGGSSIMAVQLASKFESSGGQSSVNLFTMLIDRRSSLTTIIESLSGDDDVRIKPEKLAVNPVGDLFNFEIKWKFNTGKCVDANIVLNDKRDKVLVMVGSHSGRVVVLDGETGIAAMDIDVNSRVEAAVLYAENNNESLALVGSYSGEFWCFNIDTASVKWKTNLGATIKSRACKFGDSVFVATYHGIIHRIDLDTGDKLTELKVSLKGIKADLMNSGDDLFVGTLDGTCARIDCIGNSIQWKRTLASPIFAKPVIIDERTRVLFTEVQSTIHCFNVATGDTIWTFDEAHGSIFSSVVCSGSELVFGCHDRHVYKIGESRVVWRTKLTSEAYATPFVCGLYAGSFSTDGGLFIIDMSSGDIVGRYSLPGEVFSSPAARNNTIYVGCRDDNVYRLDIMRK